MTVAYAEQPVASPVRAVADRVPGAECHLRTVAIIDAHQTFCDLLQLAVGQTGDLACVAAATTVDDGLAIVRQLRPDVVVVGLQFPDDDRDGLDVASILTGDDPDVRIVVLTHDPDIELLPRAAAAQVSSLMCKGGGLGDLYSTLRFAERGGFTVQPELLMALASPRPARTPARLERLTRREREVLDLLLAGADARRIARTLGITLNTCRLHVRTLLAKLDAHSQLEAVAIARREGLRAPDDVGA